MAVHARYQAMKAASASKKSVDTKASKGRKIRYEVYPKLVGFAAPRDLVITSEVTNGGNVQWPDEKIDALIETIKISVN